MVGSRAWSKRCWPALPANPRAAMDQPGLRQFHERLLNHCQIRYGQRRHLIIRHTAGNNPGIRPVQPRPLCAGQTSLGNSNQSLHHRRRWPVEKMAGSGLVQSTLRPEDGRLARPLCQTQQLSRAGFRPHRHTGVSKISLAVRQIVILHRRSSFFLSCERRSGRHRRSAERPDCLR